MSRTKLQVTLLDALILCTAVNVGIIVGRLLVAVLP